jgi:hypothetical protein
VGVQTQLEKGEGSDQGSEFFCASAYIRGNFGADIFPLGRLADNGLVMSPVPENAVKDGRLLSHANYLLYHAVLELFPVVVTCGVFMIDWNSRRFQDNGFSLCLGIESGDDAALPCSARRPGLGGERVRPRSNVLFHHLRLRQN